MERSILQVKEHTWWLVNKIPLNYPRLNELKLAAHELLKQKDWRSQLSMHLTTTTDVEVERREEKLKKMKKVQRKR